MMETPTVFSFDDEEWIVANTKEEAIDYFVAQTGCNPTDEGCTVTALTDDDLRSHMIRDDDGERRTFAEQLQAVVESGEKLPEYFASANV